MPSEHQKEDNEREHLTALALDGINEEKVIEKFLIGEKPETEMQKIPNSPDEDPKLAETKAVQQQERDSNEYVMNQKRAKLEERWADAPPAVRQGHLDKFDTVAKEAADQMAARHAADLEKFRGPPIGPPAVTPPPLVQPTPTPPPLTR